MSEDALERLRNRTRPAVETRDLPLISPESSENPTSNHQFMRVETEQETTSWANMETKQSTVRLEKNLTQRINQLCQSEEISREVLFESLFLYFEAHNSVQNKVLTEARKRDRKRQKIANYRRAKSMIERFGKDY
ncbi:hypothetical protein NIES4102_42970 (plasmid) [Chondrocystis sp. NIES-4102]|nr:hypothetical protein NIES4102_42970 [Chondrocystis sp. NIES-4102]